MGVKRFLSTACCCQKALACNNTGVHSLYRRVLTIPACTHYTGVYSLYRRAFTIRACVHGLAHDYTGLCKGSSNGGGTNIMVKFKINCFLEQNKNISFF